MAPVWSRRVFNFLTRWRGRREGAALPRRSPLMLKILAINMLALATLVVGLLYLGRYQEKLIATELEALLLQARLTANALGEGAVVMDRNRAAFVSPLLARQMVRRLAEATETRMRFYDPTLALLADSRILGRGGRIRMEDLPAPEEKRAGPLDSLNAFFEAVDRLTERRSFPLWKEGPENPAAEPLRKALAGDDSTQVWRLPDGGLVLAALAPVQRYRQVLGGVMLSRSDSHLDAAMREVRLRILEIFALTLLVTVLLSLYLGRAIARPLQQLSRAAERVRLGQKQGLGHDGAALRLDRDSIPDLSARHDEIGDLSISLRAMTAALAQRLGAIENFAADVAHELKNPLTSLRSAVETWERVQDPAMHQRLRAVIRDDVDRMDRLVTDIAQASRLDAELSRAEPSRVDVTHMLDALVEAHAVTDRNGASSLPPVEWAVRPTGKLEVVGIEGRLLQVVQNLLSNALSFSPPGGQVRLSASREGGLVRIAIEDDGPGIPENKLEAIFDRFYSERPRDEKFGTHSGLGLSISRQIIEAHRGTIRAENRRGPDDAIQGARFIIDLPAA